MSEVWQDTYQILRKIGAGGMSDVYLVQHKRLHTDWAMKVVSRNQNFNVLAESNILKNLRHPMLPAIIDIYEEPESICLVEEYVEGMTLEKYLELYGKVPEEQVRIWFRQLCDVFTYLHSRTPHPIIYRDMKPANVMVQPDGTLKLIDFGIAREYKKESRGDTEYFGTQGYAAPEQFGTAQTDARTDIYSLGVTMYHLLTGKSPYEPPYRFIPVRRLDARLSAGIEYILLRCTKTEPNERYKSVTQLAYDLDHIYLFDQAYQKAQTRKLTRRVFQAVILAAAAGFLITGYRLRTAEIRQENISRAYSLYQEGSYDECAAYAQELLAKYPDEKQLITILASAYYYQEDYEGAAAYYYRSAELGHMDEANLRDFAVCLAKMGNTAEASAVIEQLQSMGATEDTTSYVQGELFCAQNKYPEAVAAFENAIAAAESSDMIKKATLALATAYRDSSRLPEDDPGRMEDIYSRQIQAITEGLNRQELNNNTVLLEMLGAAYYNRALQETDAEEDYRMAGDTFLQVIRLGVQTDYLYVNAFTAYQTIGAYEEAEEVLDSMETVYSNSYTPHALRAILYIMEENEKEESQRNYQAACEEYGEAAALLTDNDDKTRFQQLEVLIVQLQAGGWLD